MKLQRNKELQAFNSFGVAATAMLYTEVNSVIDVIDIIEDRGLNLEQKLILGGGSNLLFTTDFDGLVIHNKIAGVKLIREDDEHVWIESGAGENWHQFVRHCVKNNWAGIENLSLIPGSVGAAPIQNIGAHGVELKDVFDQLTAIDLQTGKFRIFDKEDCQFGYRQSIFKTALKGRYLIVSVTLKLDKKPSFKLDYGAIKSTIELLDPEEVTIELVSDVISSIRKLKLADPAILGNGGSFFKNPVVPESLFFSVNEKHQIQFPDSNVPNYPAGDGFRKIPAAWLIEQCGWKGKRIGNTGTYENHALVLVNHGGATGKEIYNHSQRILESVEGKFGVLLEREVNVLA